MRRLLPFLALLATLVALPGAVGAQEGGSVSIRLLDAPTERADDPRARIYVVDHLHQGDRIERRIEIGNTTAGALTVELYAAAASLEDGEFRFGEGRAENELASWTSLDPAKVTVPAGGTTVSTVEVAVPDDAEDGERYAVVWAQLPSSGGTAAVVNRVGVRMYVSVGEGDEPETDFTIESLTAARDDKGRPVVRTTVINTGGRAIDLSGELQLTDGPGSLTAGPFPLDVGTTLAPGKRAPALVRLDEDVPAGPWEAKVTVRTGALEKEATATITFPDDAGTSADPVDAESARQRRIFIPLAAALVLLMLLLLLAYSWKRRRVSP